MPFVLVLLFFCCPSFIWLSHVCSDFNTTRTFSFFHLSGCATSHIALHTIVFKAGPPRFEFIARNASHFTANGLRLLSSRLSGYRQKIDGHVLIGRCDDLCTDATGSESNSKISEVEFLLVDFFPFISLALASCGRFAFADHLTVYFLVCRSLRVRMAGMLRT